MSNEILTARDGEVTHITLNRPDDGNGVTNEMAVELTHILAEAGETSHFVTLRGAGADGLDIFGTGALERGVIGAADPLRNFCAISRTGVRGNRSAQAVHFPGAMDVRVGRQNLLHQRGARAQHAEDENRRLIR